jgi:di/tricarboxylate transporter
MDRIGTTIRRRFSRRDNRRIEEKEKMISRQHRFTAVAVAGLGVLLATNVLTLDDINLQGGTLATFLLLAVLFALSGQLNEFGFMGYIGGGLPRCSRASRSRWPTSL